VDQRADAHQARFDRHIQSCIRQTVVADVRRRRTQRQHLGVRGRIDGRDRLIERAGHDLATGDDDGADRDLAGGQRQTRLFQRRAHEIVVHSGILAFEPFGSDRSGTIDGMSVELLSLDAGGVLVFPNFERISDTFARHGIRVSPDALRAADPHGRLAVDTADGVARTTDADRGSMYFRIMFERAGVPADAPMQGVLAELWAYHTEHNLWEYVPPEARAAVERLAASGLPLAIGSNANGIIHRVFERTGLRRYFSVICDSQAEGVEKPDRRFFEILVARAGGRPETTLHIGDLYHVDVVGARAAGLQAMLFDPHDLYEAYDVQRVRTLDEVTASVTEP